MNERPDRTTPSAETREADRIDADTPHMPHRMPTPEEERLAEQNGLDPDVPEHEQEMVERGANQKGEGRTLVGAENSVTPGTRWFAVSLERPGFVGPGQRAGREGRECSQSPVIGAHAA